MQESAQANWAGDAKPCRQLQGVSNGGAGPDVDIANYSSGGKPFGPDKQGLNWTFQILPFLEEGAIQNMTTQAQLQGIAVPLYVCPSRRSAIPECFKRCRADIFPCGLRWCSAVYRTM